MFGVLLGGFIETAIAPRPAQAGFWDFFFPSTDRGSASGRSRGGSIRGNCLATSTPEKVAVKELVALVPQDNKGKTTSAFPTFWFYTPVVQCGYALGQTPVQVKEGRFNLLDDRDQSVLKAPIFVKLSDQAGFARLALPKDALNDLNSKGLEVGKRYKWFFSFWNDPKQPAKNISIWGSIERVSAPSRLSEQLGKTPEKERYGVYLQNGIWFDGLTLLAEQRQAAQDAWAAVLDKFALAKVAQAPIADLQPVKPGK